MSSISRGMSWLSVLCFIGGVSKDEDRSAIEASQQKDSFSTSSTSTSTTTSSTSDKINEEDFPLMSIAIGTPGLLLFNIYKPNLKITTTKTGRLLDLIQSGDLITDNVEIFVLDEADKLLEGSLAQTVLCVFKIISYHFF